MRNILISLLLTVCLPAQADWIVNPNNVSVTRVNVGDYLMAALDNHKAVVSILTVSTRDSCTDGSVVHTVNGVNVKMLRTFRQNKYCFYTPLTETGREYVTNEFMTKLSVNWGNYTIDAVGFTDSVNKLRQLSKGAI